MTDLDLTEEIMTTGRLSDDRLEILRMVENHIVSAEEANRLLEALDRTEHSSSLPGFPLPGFPPSFDAFQHVAPPEPPRPHPSPRLIRFRVSDTEDDESMLNLVLPLALLDSGLKIAKRFYGDLSLDSKELRQSVSEGFIGTLLDVRDGSQHVEIIVE